LLLTLIFAAPLACQRKPVGPADPVPLSYFGLHIHKFPLRSGIDPNAYTAGPVVKDAPAPVWPSISFGSWRLWDTGVTWSELEPEKGQWHFERLDAAIDLAARHHVSVLLTLGLTPGWASSRPAEKSGYRLGNAAPPVSMTDWDNYIQTVASRYKGRIQAYEIWNEPNLEINFTGSPAVLADMTKRAARVIRAIDPAALIVSASVTGRYGLKWLDDYLSWGAGDVVDVVGYHLYVTPDQPEQMLPLAFDIHRTLATHRLDSKPIWDTEAGWAKPRVFASDAEAAAFLARAFLLNWAGDIRRFYWYAWDNYWWVTLRTTDEHTHQALAPARAYSEVERWMTGAVVSCSARDAKLWECTLVRDGHTSWVLWRPDGPASIHLPPDLQTARRATSVDGSTFAIQSSSVIIAPSPLLLQP
jgi:hypothetical protein